MLNPSQQAAVDYRDGHLLIIAGPGTGKTHTLVQRICELSTQLNLNESILAITFTNKAAGEMKERLEKQLGRKPQNIYVGTFHQFCIRILKENLDEEFEVADPKSIRSLFKEYWHGLSKRQLTDRLNEISKYKATDFNQTENELVLEYDQQLRLKKWIDFDDCLLKVYRLFETDINLLNRLQQRYRYIFVDEYQDINRIQQSLLKKLVGKNTQITAIGDPNQAIYGFRGSDVSFFQAFEEDFLKAKVLSLHDNYRSSENLLTASAQVIQKGEEFQEAE